MSRLGQRRLHTSHLPCAEVAIVARVFNYSVIARVRAATQGCFSICLTFVNNSRTGIYKCHHNRCTGQETLLSIDDALTMHNPVVLLVKLDRNLKLLRVSSVCSVDVESS